MTGYTSHLVKNDLDFQGFAMTCARAFGVLRDDSLDIPIPEKMEPDPYHRDKIAETTATLNVMYVVNSETWGKKNLKKQITLLKKYMESEDSQKIVDKCNAILKDVEAWTPPTEGHVRLKDYMIEQLTSTIKSNSGHNSYYADEIAKLEAMTPGDYYSMCLTKAESDLKYHKEKWAEEAARTEESNQWLDQLRKSISTQGLASSATAPA